MPAAVVFVQCNFVSAEKGEVQLCRRQLAAGELQLAQLALKSIWCGRRPPAALPCVVPVANGLQVATCWSACNLI